MSLGETLRLESRPRPSRVHLPVAERPKGAPSHYREYWLKKIRAGEPLTAEEARLAFTPRQLDLIALVALGRSNKEIAHELGLSEGTVKEYLHRLMKDVPAWSNRVMLARWAILTLGV